MSRQRAEKWFLWALPLIALRLLLPAGVMPQGTIAGPALTLCSPDNIDRSAPGKPGAPQHGGSHGDGVCPFAAAAVVAPESATVIQAVPGAALLVAFSLFGTQRIAQSGPLRTQRSRAPPSNS